MNESWTPRRPPARIVMPRRMGNPDAPTRHQVRHHPDRWRRVGRSWVVPAGVSASPEQWAAEASVCLPGGSVLTGWAALALHGCGFIDGHDEHHRRQPVAAWLPPGARTRPRPGMRLMQTSSAIESVPAQGIRCATPAQAVLDEVMLTPDWRRGVAMIDITLAAQLTTIDSLRETLDRRQHRRRLRDLRLALAHARAGVRSPQESWLRLICTLDADLPEPRLNPRLAAPTGEFIGIPDLLCTCGCIGLAIEYDGAHHRDRERHRADTARHERFRAAGIEVVIVVAGTPVAEVVQRLQAAHARALARQCAVRGWRLVENDVTRGYLADTRA